MRLKGIMTSRVAFSWTCHPKRKDAYPQSVTAPMNASHEGLAAKKSFSRGMPWKSKVKMKHSLGEISGSTAKVVSPTRPRVTLCNASALTARPNLGATARTC
jgi:hypothetical protein